MGETVKSCTPLMLLQQNLSNVIVGRQQAILLMTVALLSRGHVLIEDVPGVGKTSLIRALAESLGLSFKRLQFTPDLMPADVTGVSIWEPDKRRFQFEPGPVFTNVLLADEINRTSPRTQSSLLEAMEERQVTVDGTTHPLPEPFFVLATQNPIEYEGTFPLPEAQLDRFLMRLTLGYPSAGEELSILDLHGEKVHKTQLSAVISGQELGLLQHEALAVACVPAVREYIVRIVQNTRGRVDVFLGASPRGSLSLLRAAKSLAYLKGRAYVLPDDVKELARPVLSHRLIVAPEARMSGVTADAIVEQILASVPVPVFSSPGR